MIKLERTPRSTLLTALAALALYLVALGPAMWLVCQYPPRWVVATVYSIYEPLDLLAARNADFAKWLSAYVALWTPADGSESVPPTPAIRALQMFLAAAIGCWFIWNVVGWFARSRASSAMGPVQDSKRRSDGGS